MQKILAALTYKNLETLSFQSVFCDKMLRDGNLAEEIAVLENHDAMDTAIVPEQSNQTLLKITFGNKAIQMIMDQSIKVAFLAGHKGQASPMRKALNIALNVILHNGLHECDPTEKFYAPLVFPLTKLLVLFGFIRDAKTDPFPDFVTPLYKNLLSAVDRHYIIHSSTVYHLGLLAATLLKPILSSTEISIIQAKCAIRMVNEGALHRESLNRTSNSVLDLRESPLMHPFIVINSQEFHVQYLWSGLLAKWIETQMPERSLHLLQSTRFFSIDTPLSDTKTTYRPVQLKRLDGDLVQIKLTLSEKDLTLLIGHMHPIVISLAGGKDTPARVIELGLMEQGHLDPLGRPIQGYVEELDETEIKKVWSTIKEIALKKDIVLAPDAATKININDILRSQEARLKDFESFKREYFESFGVKKGIAALSTGLSIGIDKLKLNEKLGFEWLSTAHDLIKTSLTHYCNSEYLANSQEGSKQHMALIEWSNGLIRNVLESEQPFIIPILDPVSKRHLFCGILTTSEGSIHWSILNGDGEMFSIEIKLKRDAIFGQENQPLGGDISATRLDATVQCKGPMCSAKKDDKDGLNYIAGLIAISRLNVPSSKLLTWETTIKEMDLPDEWLNGKSEKVDVQLEHVKHAGQVIGNCSIHHILEATRICLHLSKNQFKLLERIIEFGLLMMHNEANA